MSAKSVLIVAVLAVAVLLAVKPRLRHLVRVELARRAGPLVFRLLGPLSPKAFVAALLRAAQAHTKDTRLASFLTNSVVAGVSPVEYDSWGPLAAEVGRDAEAALRELAQADDHLKLLGRATVIVQRDALARPRQPRFQMSVLHAEQLDSTTHRPSHSSSEDPTPLMSRRRRTVADVTEPLAEFEVLVNDQPVGVVALGEGRHTVGRDGACAVVIDDESVSRRHSVIAVSREFTTIADLGSRNGVFVGKAKADVPLLLSDGDLITLSGGVVLRVLRSGARRKAS